MMWLIKCSSRATRLMRPCLALWVSLCCAIGQADNHNLSLLTWSDYIAPEVITAFEKEFNARIEVVSFDNEDQRDRKMTAANGRGFDLILLNNSSLPDYIALGWLAPVNTQAIDHFQHIDPRWAYLEADTHYAIPYLWGTVGIAWRQDLVSEPPTDWGQFFDLAAAQSHPMELMENHRDLMGAALLAGGHSVNSHSESDLKQASRIIRRALKADTSLNNPILTEQAPLVRGEVHLAMMYNGDALFLAELQPNIRYAVPTSGTILWVDYWAIARYSQSVELAHKFLDFLNRPDVAARNSEYLHYASTNYSALKLLDDMIYNNPQIYPSKTVIEQAEVTRALPPKIRARYQHWYHRAKIQHANRSSSR